MVTIEASGSSRPEAAALPLPALLSPIDLAAYLGVPLKTIYRWRSVGDGPPGYRVGRHVRFRPEDVEAWLLARGATDQPAKESPAPRRGRRT